MLKLYKKTDGIFRYWEACEDARQITIHWGIVADEGENRTVELAPGENADSRIKRESEQPRNEGYRKIPPSKHTRLVIQYPIQGIGTNDGLDKRIAIEDLMNERLGWTGLGYCDGGRHWQRDHQYLLLRCGPDESFTGDASRPASQ
jgi:hypothetical protein